MKNLITLVKNGVITPNQAAQMIVLGKNDNTVSGNYFCNTWTKINGTAGQNLEGDLLIISDNPHLKTHWQSTNNAKIIHIKSGEEFNKTGTHEITSNLTQNKQLQILADYLEQQELKNVTLLYDCYTDNKLRQAKNINAFISLLQVLLQRSPFATMHVIVPVFDTQDIETVYCKALSGFLRSLSKEYENVSLKTILLEEPALYEQVYQELFDRKPGFEEISIKNSLRYVKQTKLLSGITLPPFDGNNKTFLITGGSGHIARLVCTWLISSFTCKVILVGRSSTNKNEQLEQLLKLYPNVKYFQQNLANASLNTALKQAISEGVHGVFHLAGAANDKLFKDKDLENWENEVEAKTLGTVHLDNWTKDQNLDFFLAGSSITSIIGNQGQTAYGYANAFLDYFTIYRNKLINANQRTGKSALVNWSVWQDGGMHIPASIKEYFKNVFGLQELSLQIGIESILLALHRDNNQLIVTAGNRDKNTKLFHATTIKNNVKQTTQSVIVDKYNYLLSELSNIITSLMKVKQENILPDTEFVQYGFDSISFADFANKINKSLKTNISPSIFFRYLTIGALAKYMEQEFGDKLNPVQKSEVIQIPTKVNIPHRFNIPKPISPKESSNENYGQQDIAVIGINGTFPGAEQYSEFWKKLMEGKNLVTEIPQNRWDWKSIYGDPSNTKNQTNIKWGGFIADIDKFDRHFFKISAREAALMDPQQRLFLQCVWSLIEDAGYNIHTLKGTNTAVYVGVASTDYNDLILTNKLELEPHYSTGTGHSIVANRISYMFDLQGPSEAIDTACSSSLVAIHRAVENIKSGDCDMAIAGGVNVLLNPNLFISFSKAGMLSPEGKCKTFDNAADGYVRGEGVGAVLLKSYAAAIRDKDHIYGIIKGSAINHGGKTQSLTAPNPEAQANLIKKALQKGGITPKDIAYIEAHGTGTKLGDPLEMDGLKAVFTDTVDRSHKTGVGSVKTNIGHLETAAGIAGVIKVLLSFKHNIIPPTIHFKKLNSYINLDNTPLVVIDKPTAWNELGERQETLAGISSFGFGGANAHIVLQQVNQPVPKTEPGQEQIILLSARNKAILINLASNLKVFLIEYGQQLSLSTIAYTLQVGRVFHEERAALVVKNITELIDRLTCIENNQTAENTATGKIKEDANQKEILPVAGQNPIKIAAMWVEGHQFQWENLYDETPGRIALPTYPFEKTSSWITDFTAVSSQTVNSENTEVIRIQHHYQEEASENIADTVTQKIIVLQPENDNNSDKTDLINLLHAKDLLHIAENKLEENREEIERYIKNEPVVIVVFNVVKEDFDYTGSLALFNTVKNMLHILVTSNENNNRPSQWKFLFILKPNQSSLKDAIMPLLGSIVQENNTFTFKIISISEENNDKINDELSMPFQNQFVVYNPQRKVHRHLVKEFKKGNNHSERIEKDGVYLVTGGLGALGTLVGKHIRTKGGHVIATGRTVLSPVQEDELRTDGTLSMYISADVSKKEDVENIAHTILHKYGTITGIFHCAGVTINKKLEDTTNNDFQNVWSAKVEGAKHLASIAEKHSVKFVLFYGSMVGVTGNAGQAVYGFANGSLLTLCHKLNDKVENFDCYVINWPLWDSDGMQMPQSVQNRLFENYGMVSMPINRGMHILDEVLAQQPGIYSFMHGVRDKIEKYFAPAQTKQQHSTAQEESSMSVSALTYLLMTTLAEVLRVAPSEIDESNTFEMLGLDSILINSFTEKIQKSIPEFKVTLMFEFNTIASLAWHCNKNFTIHTIDETKNVLEVQEVVGEKVKKHSKQNNDIAIIGMHGKYPGAENLDEFWLNLEQKLDLIKEIPTKRWEVDTYFSPEINDADKGKYYCKWGGYLDNVTHFDPLFFNISPKDAEVMDPQERLFIQSAWNALEDAGYMPLSRLDEKQINRKVGVFAGVTSNTYQLHQPSYNKTGNIAIPTSQPWSVPNRVSYLFNLTGPSMPVDTACSSSLVAIHYACKSILNGECKMALAGGVNLYLHPNKYIHLSKLRMLSPTGKCHSFGTEADGFVPAEGVGLLVLKPLQNAIDDGDSIKAVIKGSAVNHGGRTNGYSVPNVNSQVEVIKMALKDANLQPDDIDFIEAHGTGTALGDPIEIAGIDQVFRNNTRDSKLRISSVKSNIGHAEAAAGVAGITKITMQFLRQKLVPTIHCNQLNHKIDLSNPQLHIQREGIGFEMIRRNINQPLRAGISSFGAGGTNAHIILEEYRHANTSKPGEDDTKYVFVLSAKNEENLRQYAANILNFIKKRDTEINDGHFAIKSLAYTLLYHRQHFENRVVFTAKNSKELQNALLDFLHGTANQSVSSKQISKRNSTEKQITVTSADEAMQVWLQGNLPIWKALSRNSCAISAPGYPFTGKHYWYKKDEEQNIQTSKQENNIFKERFSITDDGKAFQFNIPSNHRFVADHLVKNQKVLPGTTYLEMMRIVARQKLNNSNILLKNITWVNPLVFNSIDQNVKAEYRNGGSNDEIIISKNGDGRYKVLAQGLINKSVSNAETRIIDTIKNKSFLQYPDFDETIIYNHFLNRGLNYGTAFRLIQRLWVGKDVVIAQLKAGENEYKPYDLHPALVDAALQSIIGFYIHEESNGKQETYLPFVLKNLTIHKNLTGTCFVYTQSVQSKNNSRSFNIALCNEAGEVCIEITDFIINNIKQDIESNHRPENELIYLQSEWTPSSLDQKNKRAIYQKIVVFTNEQKKYQAIKQQFGEGIPVVQVSNANEFQSISEYAYTINPNLFADYQKLLKELTVDGVFPDLCVHAYRDNLSIDISIEQQLSTSFLPLFYWSKSLIKEKVKNKVRQIVTFNNPENKNYFKSGLYGLAKTISREYNKMAISVIEILEDNANNEYKLAEIIQLESRYAADNEIRYRQGNRETLQLSEVGNREQASPALRTNGTYLITGSMGGLGKMLASHLIQKYNANLILTDLWPTDNNRVMQNMAELSSNKQNITYYQADLSMLNSVLQLSKNIEDQELHGIFHIAGYIKDSLLADKTDEEIKNVLSPKVAGTLHLDTVFSGNKLDFFAIYSSIAAFTGNVGQADYTFANRFQNAFAEHRTVQTAQGRRFGKTIAINWPLWENGGMHTSVDTQRYFEESTGMYSLNTSNGLKALEICLSGEHAHMIVIQGIKNKVFQVLKVQKENKQQTNQTMSSENKSQKITAVVLQVISTIIHVDIKEITIDSNISDYGLDSVDLTKLSNQLNKEFDHDLTPATFFEYSTIQELIDYLSETVEFEIEAEHAPQQMLQEADKLPERNMEALGSITTQERDLNGAIAIIGINGKFPGAENPSEFFETLLAGKDLIQEIPPDRWDWRKYYGDPQEKQNKTFVNKAAFMADIDKFDAEFFNISPREAALMDPVQRLFLECSLATIEDAGYKISDFSNTNTGLYVGLINTEYADLMMEMDLPVEAHMATGVSRSVVANRISYLLNLRGPSEVIDTACSSALIAIDKGIESIKSGRCKMVLAGGINVILSPRVHLSYSKAGMLSPDGQSKTFDENANGYARGEGVGAVLLKALDQAIADGDHIYGIIRASAVNHGGHANALTAPNPNAQAELLVDAYTQTNLNPLSISYIEAHGTGTSLGDPIEINGLKKGFVKIYEKYNDSFGDAHKIAIGAVKTNVGHLEAAAAMPGLFKVLLGMKHKIIPANRNFNKRNPFIDLSNTPFFIADKNCKWETIQKPDGTPYPRRAGVSSFGFGGVNAHLVIEEYAPEKKENSKDNTTQIICLSAKHKTNLMNYAKALLNFLNTQSSEKSTAANDQNYIVFIRGKVKQVIASLVEIPATEIDNFEEIADLGLDQLAIDKLIRQLESDFGVKIPSRLIYKTENIDAFSNYIFEQNATLLKGKIELPHVSESIENATYDLSLVDLAYTFYFGREQYSERMTFICNSVYELKLLLDKCLEQENLTKTLWDGRAAVTSRQDEFTEQAQAWKEGNNTDPFFSKITEGGKRIPLPTYPFTRTRHWIKTKKQTGSTVNSTVAKANIQNEKKPEVTSFEKNSSVVEEISVKLLLGACNEMKLFDYIEEGITEPDLLQKSGTISKYGRLFKAIINILKEYNIIDENANGRLQFAQNINRAVVNEQLLDEEGKNKLLTQHPDYKNHLILLYACTKDLAQVLGGEKLSTDVIFPDSGMEMVENVYKGNISANFYNDQLVQTIENLVVEKQKEQQAEIKILEIGAGTGGTSEIVLERLQKFNRVKYYYTDISQAFVKYGRKKYGAKHDFVEFKTLNIENRQDVEEFTDTGFDIIIAANVLHATSNISETLTNANVLLRTGGTLVVNELVSKKNFLTLTFGLLDGWWLFKDSGNRIDDTPLLSVGKWATVLQQSGYDQTEFLGIKPEQGGDQAIIVSTKVQALQEPDSKKEHILTQVIEKAVAETNTNGPNFIEKSITQILSEILEVDIEAISMEKPYIDYGIDSILAVEGVNQINKTLGIILRTTDFFNYVNIKELSTYIHDKYPNLQQTGMQESIIAEIPEKQTQNTTNAPDDLMLLLQGLEDGTKTLEEVDRYIELFS